MTNPRLTASALWRAEPCPASVVLPAIRREYKDAEAGRRAHAALEASPPPGSFAEVAFAYNVLSGEARELGRSIDRAYGELAEGEIPCTADLIAVQPDHILGTEWKSGNGHAERLAGVFDKPRENLQLQHNAIAACTAYDKPRAIWEIAYLKTGEVKDVAFDCFDFASIALRLRKIWETARLARELLEQQGVSELVALDLVREGPWCWRCECVKSCPLKSKGRKAA